MAASRSRTNADRDAAGNASGSSKPTRTSRRAAAAAAAAAATNLGADGGGAPAGSSRTGTPDMNERGTPDLGHGDGHGGHSHSHGGRGGGGSNKPSPLDTNTITHAANEFLAGMSSAANPARRELAIELLGKPTVVAIETHGLLNQPLMGTQPTPVSSSGSATSGSGGNAAGHNGGAGSPAAPPVNIPPGMALSSSGLITSTASSSGCGAAALLAAAAVVAERPNIAATAEIDDLPVDALRRYKIAYKIPQLGAQSFQGYLLNSAVGRKTWSYRIGKSNNRVPKNTLAQAVKRNFGNHSVRESEVMVDFIYSVKTQDNAFKYRFTL